MHFFDLPEVIFYLLQGYLSSDEFRNIFNCSKYDETMIRLKKKLCVYHLNEFHSLLYFSPGCEFQTRIVSIIDDPKKQLGINFDVVGSVIDLFGDRDDSELFAKPIIEVNNLKDINSLKLVSQEIWNKVLNLPDLSIFSSIQYLDLSSCISMVKLPSGLLSIRELSISNFYLLSDISSLSACINLLKVKLSNCDSLEDINALAHVPDIEISNCSITNEGIAQLGSCLKRLKVNEIDSLSNIDHLTSLETLSIENCRCFKSIKGLSNLKYINLVDIPYLQNYPNEAHSLKDVRITACPNLHVHYSKSILLKKFCYHNTYSARSLLGIHKQVNLLSMKKCWQSLEVLKLHFQLPMEFSLNILAGINSLRKLDLYYISDYSLDIHLFQQIVWLSINKVDGFVGIGKAMPNLRTLSCPNVPLSAILSSIYNHNKLNLQIILKAVKPSIQAEDIVPLNLYNFINISTLRIISQFIIPKKKTGLMKYTNKKYFTPFKSLTTSTVDSIKRHGILQLDCDIPAQLTDLMTTFSQLRVLVLHRFSDYLVNLSELGFAGIDKIPILAITETKSLKSLYPPHATPTHEHLYLDDCESLVDLGAPSSLRLISVVSIRKCAALKDVRGLLECRKIRFHKEERFFALSFEKEIKGFFDIVDQLETFISLKEIEEVRNTFDFHHSHQLRK